MAVFVGSKGASHGAQIASNATIKMTVRKKSVT